MSEELRKRIAELEASNEQYLTQITDVTAENIRYRQRAKSLKNQLAVADEQIETCAVAEEDQLDRIAALSAQLAECKEQE